ncbi:MAG TPA: aminodeoxychorismate synthase component I [Pyrinomonadaceae bacterium]
MPKIVFGSEPADRWQLAFDNPSEIVEARRSEEVLPLLEFAETAAQGGAYVAVMISYEAAPAFDSALSVHAPEGFPLAWAAAFRGPVAVSEHPPDTVVPSAWTPKIKKREYEAAVTRIRELIAAGDTYQVNYSFPLTASFSGDAYAWYRELCLAQGAHYSAYLDLGRYCVLSLSPELFFERQGDRVVTRPMKGTARRGRWPDEDEALKQQLQNSVKDRAENIMIVDLLRNDLGKVSVPGRVRASSLFEAERYETVWQLTSTVESALRPGTNLVELMSALFPCGSVTGAPKIRTMQIIRELEPFPRGAYTGAIGFLRPNGDCIFNVAIRTVVIDTQTGVATFGVGGGVTIDSTAEGEYEECLVKSRFLQSEPVEFELFETMLIEDGKIFLLERHLERLRKSASFFGFQIGAELERLVDEYPRSGTWKLKVSLRKDGRLTTEASPVSNQSKPKRVALASTAVHSSDRFLFHKTTKRDFYTAQLHLRPDCDDIIFWNERGEVTESSIANTVVSIDDQLFTPPISSGLLAGTFRDQLLAEGKIKERVITLEELKNVREFFLINSVRKWMKAELIVEQDLRASASKLL